jgi:hypothetical protein
VIAAAENTNSTQCSIILARLMDREGEWVPMPELADLAGCYAVNSRVSNLRDQLRDTGSRHIIENRVETGPHQLKRSFYRIIDPSLPVQSELPL